MLAANLQQPSQSQNDLGPAQTPEDPKVEEEDDSDVPEEMESVIGV